TRCYRDLSSDVCSSDLASSPARPSRCPTPAGITTPLTTKGPCAMSDPAANPIRVRKIGHVGLYCRDLDRMVDFYTRVLGFQVSRSEERRVGKECRGS